MTVVRGSALIVALLAVGVETGAQAPVQQTDVAHASQAFIRPGDKLSLRVYREPDLSNPDIYVNERGEATLPKLGVVPVGRFRISEAADSIRSRYALVLRDAEVDLVVLRRVAVGGDVRRPDVYFVDVATTLRDIIAHAGGLTTEGDPKKVSLWRGGSMTRVRDWQSDGGLLQLRSGDQVFIGTKPWLARNALGIATTAAVLISTAITIVQATR